MLLRSLRLGIGICVGMFALGAPARAATSTFIAPDKSKGIILVKQQIGGQVDGDAMELYNALRVEPQAAPGGQGKGIRSDDQILTLSCVTRGDSPVQFSCSIVIRNSPESVVSTGKISYRVTGDRSAVLTQAFLGDGTTSFAYQTEDGKLEIRAVPGEFLIQYLAH